MDFGFGDRNHLTGEITYCSYNNGVRLTFEKPEILLDRYIINENATILFWSDGTKTVSKRDKEDKFDKELGYLFAYFYKKSGYSKQGIKRVLSSISYPMIKTFLLEFYCKEMEITRDKARKYLSNLKVD